MIPIYYIFVHATKKNERKTHYNYRISIVIEFKFFVIVNAEAKDAKKMIQIIISKIP